MTYEQLTEINRNLKKTPIHGKNYADVASRIQAFRSLFPNGIINTQIVEAFSGADHVLFKAEARDEDGHLLATGHAHEDRNSSSINKTSYIENCETSAIGRALGALGIGSDEFITSAEELNNALEAQEVIKQTDKLIDTIIDMADGDRERVNTYVGNLFPGNKLEDLDYPTLVRLKANIAKKIAAQPKPETAVPVYNIERRS